MADPVTPPPAAPLAPPPASPDPAAPPPAETTTRPEWLPENLWDAAANKPVDFSNLRQPAADVPSAPEAYAIPEKIGEFETSQIDPAFVTSLRKHAFTNGMGQEAFTAVLTDYATDAQAAADTYFTEQETAIGDNREVRVTAVSTWLDGNLPKNEAEALKAVATNADVFKALERVMNKGVSAAPRDPPPPPVTRKTADEIKVLRNSPAYTGRGGPRDMSVVKQVDDWYKAEYPDQPKS